MLFALLGWRRDAGRETWRTLVTQVTLSWHGWFHSRESISVGVFPLDRQIPFNCTLSIATLSLVGAILGEGSGYNGSLCCRRQGMRASRRPWRGVDSE